MSKPHSKSHPDASRTTGQPAEPTPANNAETADERLDEALEESFPASDPIAIDPDDDDPPRTST